MALLLAMGRATGQATHAETIRAGVAAAIGREDVAVVMAWVGDALVGVIIVQGYTDFMSGEHCASQVALWVDPAHRGTLGRRLVGAAERWARCHGVVRMQLAVQSDSEARLFRGWGYAPRHRTVERRLDEGSR